METNHEMMDPIERGCTTAIVETVTGGVACAL